MTKERGIILGADTTIDRTKNVFYMRSPEPSASLLRYAILYWDKIAYPLNNVINAELPNIDFLEKEGILIKPQFGGVYGSGSRDMIILCAKAQLMAFEYLNNQDPDMWTLGPCASDVIAFSSSKVRERSVEIEINNLLPIPPYDIPLEDLLKLKQKRRDEFKLLRMAVDELYDEALQLKQFPRAKDVAIRRLQAAINDVRSVVSVSWCDRVKSSMEFSFSIPKTIKESMEGFILGQFLSQKFGMPGLESVGAAVGASLSMIKFEAKIGSTLEKLPVESRNFAYLYHVEKAFPGTIKH